MNTYNIEYQGITIVEEVKPEDLDGILLQVKGIATLTGKDTEKIEVLLNKDNNRCSE
jgi:hypothetical protein